MSGDPADAEGVRDRAVGALLGLAVGDAVGTTLEFSSRDASPPLTDMVGCGPFGLQPGQWTDDTSMALCLADSLLVRGGLDPHDLMTRFVRWWHQGEYSCTGQCFDIGTTTAAALRRFETTGDPLAGDSDPWTAGNGSLMRLSPVAIFHHRETGLAVIAARTQSTTTHAAPAALDACGYFARLLVEAICGAAKDEVLARRHLDIDPAIAVIAAGVWRGKARNEIASSGYVVHTLEAALWCVDRAEEFEEAVLLAANLADDADTVAAVTGQLAGALWGVSGIPDHWRRRVAWGERIEALALALSDGPVGMVVPGTEGVEE